MAPRITPRLLKGFRDYLPEVMIARRAMISTISEVFELYGFSPLDTPALEYSEILLGKYGDDAEKLLYRFRDNGDRDVCMRYDLTIPLARVTGMNRQLPLPFKRYQIGTVWRAENPGRGRFREFSQCDADIVGSASLLADAELMALGSSILEALGLRAQIRINNRKVFRGLQELLGIEEGTRMDAVLRVVDKLPKVGEAGVRRELGEDLGLAATLVDRVISFCMISGDNTAVLEQLSALLGSSEIGLAGIAELRQVLTDATLLGVSADKLQLDPSIARGLDYYTGTVFETFLLDLDGFGSVMSGGRYDDLIGLYAGDQIPAVGLSVGLDRLLAGLLELGRLNARKSVTDVLVAIFAPEQQAYAMRIVRELRKSSICAEITLDPSAKLRKQMKYADSLEIPIVIIAGPDEEGREEATLRDMKGGDQLCLPLTKLVKEVRQRVGERAPGRFEYRTWNWPFTEEQIGKVPECRGVYILRDELGKAVEVGNASDARLRTLLLERRAASQGKGVATFDWYEVGNQRFGEELTDFLKSRLLRQP